MRNTLPTLALLALAAAASAHDVTATSTSTTDVTLAANPFVQQIGLYQDAYHVGADGADLDASDDLGGSLVLGGSTSAGHAGDGLTAFSVTATATATLDIPDYSKVPQTSADYGNSQVFQGSRYYITLKNTTGVDQTVSFHVKVSRSFSGAAGSPIGLLVNYPDGSSTPGAYAESDFGGGVIDKSTGDVFTFPNTRNGYFSTSTFDGTASPAYGDGLGVLDEFDATYTLPGREIHTFQVYAASTAYADFVPVPEPSAFAALGLGALAFLRRRRA